MERYFLTVEETVHRVLSAAASCSGDEVIAIPVMGDPIRIAHLPRYPIEQASVKDGEITYTGFRHGDKVQEQFISHRESNVCGPLDAVQWVNRPGEPEGELAVALEGLDAALDEMNLSKLLNILIRLVPAYESSAFLLQQAGAPATH